MKIGLALSGGGIRATVFHLGVLARLAAANRLEEISLISTVSGGSLCIGLVFAANGGTWPSSREFCDRVVANIQRLLAGFNMEVGLFLRTILRPQYLLHRQAQCLASLLEDKWGVTGELCSLPEVPRWIINATSHETGKRWRFERKRMGDFEFGLSPFPKFPVSAAVAASAAVPFAIGPLRLDTTKYHWERYRNNETYPIDPEFKKVHLWDGALYDNLGTEAFAKRKDGYDFLIVSDASAKLKPASWSRLKRYPRLYSIASSQAQGVRTRRWMESFIEDRTAGRYLKIGNSMEYIFREANRHAEIDTYRSHCMSPPQALEAKDFNLTLRRLTEQEFINLFRHGFEVADCTLYAYWEEQFPLLTFNSWSK
jgi:NTE family protein